MRKHVARLSLGRIVSWASAGVDPRVMGTGPIPSSRMALKKAGWSTSELDLIESNEAFAAQACAVNRALAWDTDKVNVNGGAIAIGHPVGASGGRILVTLLYEMQRRNAKKGIATMCIGGGMGIADLRRTISAEDAVDRVAIVTGGTRGIGAAVSLALQAAGYSVVANYARDNEKADAFTSETGIPARKWDVSDLDCLSVAVAAIADEVRAGRYPGE